MRCLILLICLIPLTVQAKVNVVTSILPLQQITAAIMQTVGEPELLINNQHSAHHFAFKPSHFGMLKSADLVIWVSRHFESGFQRMPEILQKSTKSLELLRVLGLQNEDGHIWYSPVILERAIEQISQALIEIDPVNAAIYQGNQQKLQLHVAEWAQYSRNQFAKVKPQYLLDHDFLIHFQADFQLQAIATIHDSHDQHSGIQTLRSVEEKLSQSSPKCLLTNESKISKTGRNLADKFALSVHHIELTDDFIKHLYRLTEVLASCR